MTVGAAGRLRAPADADDELRRLLADVVERSRREPGCLAYSIAEDLVVAGDFWVLEIWVDDAALEAHRATVHMQELRRTISELGIDVAVQRWSDVPWNARIPD